jgi:DNA-binding transcriptional regulator YhcF (GntR family)
MVGNTSQPAAKPDRARPFEYEEPLVPWAIDRDAEVPIGVQLAWALRTRIGTGELRPGQRLPGLREMAEAVGVNLNTVRTVYQRLEHEGLVDSQQGSGTFVASSPAPGAGVGSIAATAARTAHETGVDPRAVAAALYVAAQPPAPAPGGQHAAERSEAGHRRILREQIATLERTVAELEAEHPGVAPAAARSRRGFGPALLTADELARVRAVLIRRLTIVQAAIDQHAEQQRNATAGAAGAQERARGPKRAPAKAKAKAQKPARSGAARRVRPTPRPAPAGG